MTNKALILRVAVPSPLHQCFDYLPPIDHHHNALCAGMRVKIPFGARHLIGMLVDTTTDSTFKKLKRAHCVLDIEPILPPSLCRLCNFASRYYHHPIGEVYTSALPTLLRKGKMPSTVQAKGFSITTQGKAVTLSELTRSPRQQALLKHCQQQSTVSVKDILEHYTHAIIKSLEKKGWIEPCVLPANELNASYTITAPPYTLNEYQQKAVQTIAQQQNKFSVILLEGVTGSGKTEVYLQAIAATLQQNKQALVLVPEISLTPQTVARFQARFGSGTVALLHSKLTNNQRLTAWHQAQTGAARIIIGTRSAIFVPLAQPGLFIIDEEHDASFKQQEGFRYNARDLAIVRAQFEQVPILLGSATPALESFYNAKIKRYSSLKLPARTGGAHLPDIKLIDIRGQYLENGLSKPLIHAIHTHLSAEHQVLVFINRRGYAPVLICHACSWVATCPHCDAKLTFHTTTKRLRCHHCFSSRPLYIQCPDCTSTELRAIGQGTQRIEESLQQLFPKYPVLRIDKDKISTKTSLETTLKKIHQGGPQILVGTQMLAKGHHFPNVTLVSILENDNGLHSIDFRASERMGQLVLQVAGRAGRAEHKGEVLIQTCYPEHPLMLMLAQHDYAHFATTILNERRQSALPPFAYMALLRASAPVASHAHAFLNQAKICAQHLNHQHVSVRGPIASPMERRAGRYRYQLLFEAEKRQLLQTMLNDLVQHLQTLKVPRKVRWILDVDPLDVY